MHLGFNNGVALEDLLHLLAGAGKRVRHIHISETAELKDTAIQGFIKAAIQQAERPDPATPQIN